MARGVASPAPAPLPKVSFVKVQDDTTNQPTGVHDQQARSYGYNDFSDFRRPEHYIRYIEPLESELAVQVEYDMDEQDQEWLDAINAERKKEQMDKVSYEIFEIVMDRLEKEWFDLTKNIPKPDLALPSEDSTCAICDDSEGENTNAIVFCDGCNLAVHQDCYGVPYIPEGQWLCRKCTVSPENPVSCILCPNEGGAFKQTVHGDWVHLLCAIWVPETRVANDVFMEPITGVDRISKQRWRLKCSVCDIRQGACIQCTKSSCFLAFHATCARKEKLLMPMKSSQGSEAPALACYCEKHLPKEQQEARAAALAAEHSDDHAYDGRPPSPKSSKIARAYAKTYTPGPPLVPHVIVERILQYIGKVVLRHKREFVLLVCKFWSLKREARRGAAFLKRLHLEPWTASSGGKQQTDEEKLTKLEFMKRLRRDLDSIRTLTELSRKRESRKRDQAETIQDVFSRFLFSNEPPLRMAFERIMGFDRQDYFKNPVSKIDVPDYFDIINHPMCWTVIDRKLDRHEYWDLQDFKHDVNLVLNNAMTYNKQGTPFFKAAQRIKTSIEPILAELDKIASREAGYFDEATSPLVAAPSDSKLTIGDLEPPLYLLDLLVTEDVIKDQTSLIIGKEPLVSLFSYELPQFRPPPPPPLPKPKRNRRADRERKRREREAQAQGLDASPGFRAPRTRRAVAAAAAFEAEVAGSVQAGPSDASEDATTESVSAGSPRKRAKRTPASTPAQEPQVVQDVDNQQSFRMFDNGWIFPPDQRRGGRAPIERYPLPPPRKKLPKTSRDKSQLSTFSTSAAENETLHATTLLENAPELASAVPAPEATSEPMEVDQTAVEVDQVAPETEPENMDVDKPDERIPVPKPVITEELDTPGIRRKKNMQRRAERLAEAEAAVAATTTPSLEAETAATSTLVPPAEEEEELDSDSDLTSLGDSTDDEVITEQPAANRSPASPRRKQPAQVHSAGPTTRRASRLQNAPPVEAGAVVLGDGEYLEESFPWWPAVVFEEDDPSIPKYVLDLKDESSQNEDKQLHVIRFYDSGNTWQWVRLPQLRMLGEDTSLDDDMLAKTSRRQKWKNQNVRGECRKAYR
ncbi:PHD-zinc-finger like domain-containing protein [Sparassis latifolia]